MKVELVQLRNLLKSSKKKMRINRGRQVLSMSLPLKVYKEPFTRILQSASGASFYF